MLLMSPPRPIRYNILAGFDVMSTSLDHPILRCSYHVYRTRWVKECQIIRGAEFLGDIIVVRISVSLRGLVFEIKFVIKSRSVGSVRIPSGVRVPSGTYTR